MQRARLAAVILGAVAVAVAAVGCMLSFDPGPAIADDGGAEAIAPGTDSAPIDAATPDRVVPGGEEDAPGVLICNGRPCDGGCCYRADAAATPFECTMPVSCDEYYYCTSTRQCAPGVCCRRATPTGSAAYFARCDSVDACLGLDGAIAGEILCESFDQDCPKNGAFITCAKPREPFYVCR